METMSPLILESSRFTLPSEGSFQAINPVELMNPNKTPMLIDEFRFTAPIILGLTPTLPFSTVLAKISMGNSELTNDYVPLPVLAPTYMSAQFDSMLVWHLPKPLWVPPHVQINCQLKVQLPVLGVASWTPPGSDISWSVAIAGRSLPGGQPTPRKIPIPWVCATSARADSEQHTSKDNEIGNPFDSDFAMTQMVGYNLMGNTVGEANFSSVVKSPITIQATYGSGKMLIRDPVPFLSLFPPVRPIVRLRGLMKPKDFLKVVLGMPQQTAAYSSLRFTSVGMVGYRMIDTPRGAPEV